MTSTSISQRLANPSPNNIMISKRQNTRLLSLARTAQKIKRVYNGRVSGDMIFNIFEFSYAVLDMIDISPDVRCEYIATNIIAIYNKSPGLLTELNYNINHIIPIRISDGLIARSHLADEISCFVIENLTKETSRIFSKITSWHHPANGITSELFSYAIELLSHLYREDKYVVNYLYNYIQTHSADGSPTSDKIKFMFMKAELDSAMNI